MNEQMKEKLRQNLYYVIIVVLSLAVLLIFPFLHSDLDAGMLFPTTSWGWVLFWFEKISMTCINLAIFTSFKKQGKVNVQDDDKFKKANEIMNKVKTKIYKPLSPGQYQARSYGKKGTTLVISTFASLVAITNMILRFDYLALISYGITLVMAIIFGIFAMKSDELYWTNDYYFWALKQAEETLTLDEAIEEDIKAHPELATAAQKPPVSQSNDLGIQVIGPIISNSIQGENEA